MLFLTVRMLLSTNESFSAFKLSLKVIFKVKFEKNGKNDPKISTHYRFLLYLQKHGYHCDQLF